MPPIAYATTGTPWRFASCPMSPKGSGHRLGMTRMSAVASEPGDTRWSEPAGEVNAQPIVLATDLPRHLLPAAALGAVAGQRQTQPRSKLPCAIAAARSSSSPPFNGSIRPANTRCGMRTRSVGTGSAWNCGARDGSSVVTEQLTTWPRAAPWRRYSCRMCSECVSTAA